MREIELNPNIPKFLNFEEFIEWCPDGKERYELINGEVIEMQTTGKHEEIIAFMTGKLFLETHRLQLPYFLPRNALIKVQDKDTGYRPDIMLVDKTAINTEPLWEKASTITKGESVKLAIEVVSTNWRDDYGHKLIDYEGLGIAEYWIIDYLALGGKRYIGSPKQPTITVCNLAEDEYQLKQFRGNDRIICATFPDLDLTVEQVFRAE